MLIVGGGAGRELSRKPKGVGHGGKGRSELSTVSSCLSLIWLWPCDEQQGDE